MISSMLLASILYWTTLLPTNILANPDPCAAIAGRAFVVPSEALACFKTFPFNETLRQNVLTNVARVMDFYTFEEFYLNSPPPFEESTVDIRAGLSMINFTAYETDYDFNKNLFDFTNQLNDGHTRWIPNCYISFQSVLPAPVVNLEVNGKQNIYIAPDSVQFINLLGPAFTGFFDKINFNWQRLAGAKVLSIEGQPAYQYADFVAKTVSGNFLDHGIRFNSAFTSYRISGTNFAQRLGDIAGPLSVTKDHLTFKLIPVNSTVPETVVVPFLAAFSGKNFTDSASYWAANCAATNTTNGVDLKTTTLSPHEGLVREAHRMQRAVIIDELSSSAVGLPLEFQPTLPTINSSTGVIRSYILPDNKTGVMFVGSFEANFTHFQFDVDAAIKQFQASGVTHLLIDLHNNGGGFVCLGQFLLQYLAGSDFRYASFQSTTRANPLAQKILKSDIALGLDGHVVLYTADNWLFVNGTPMNASFDYYDPTAPFSVNGVSDPTSQRFLDSCESGYNVSLPKTPPIALRNVAIVSNGACASTCALFSTLMHELHQTIILVFGGRPGQEIQYKGLAGNQVLEWTELDTEIKTANLKDDPLAPPDLLVAGNFRHNWRAAWSFLNENEPIAYLSETPDVRLPYTADTYNNPQNLWILARETVFDDI